MANEMTIFIPQESNRLPDNAAYTNRFEVKSESSNAVYVIAQSKSGKWWSCGCRGWISKKHCKHLRTLSLPGDYIPKNVIVKGGK
jgi:hypothetical protein